jgi:hypothetical protein
VPLPPQGLEHLLQPFRDRLEHAPPREVESTSPWPTPQAPACFLANLWRFLCPTGFERSSSSLALREAFSCQAGARPLVACSPPLAALRDSLDRDPAARPDPGPLGVRKRRRHRHPVPVRALGPRGLGRHGRWHPPGGLNTPLTESVWADPHGHAPALASRLRQVRGAREGGGEIRPAGGRSHGAGACGHRAARPVGGNAGPTERLMRGRGTARVRTPGCACSVARNGGSEGCARRAARATAHSPRGQRKPPRSGMKGAGRASAWQNKSRLRHD